ncbi:hypothetical protein NGC20_13450 [Enterococcus hirae]|nr:hypothetical protein [Enterococcus hirae]MEB7440991.1 hypothetical protein [Enterococcus hirae]
MGLVITLVDHWLDD